MQTNQCMFLFLSFVFPTFIRFKLKRTLLSYHAFSFCLDTYLPLCIGVNLSCFFWSNFLYMFNAYFVAFRKSFDKQ